jgi:uncharacterized protein
MKKYEILLFVAFGILSETALRLNESIGFVLYFALASTVWIVLSRAKKTDESAKLLMLLLILPLYRISELFINFNLFWNVLIGYILLLFLGIYYLVTFKIKVGLKGSNLRFIGFAILIGFLAGFFFSKYFSLEINKTIVYVILFGSIAEEILFRGLILKQTENLHGKVFAIIISSLMYGVFSLNFGLGFAVFAFIFSIFTGWMYTSMKSIYLAILANVAFHIMLLT